MAVLGTLISITIMNIGTQIEALLDANKKVAALEEKMAKLSEENNNLERQIEYATSSAFVERQARELFGLGTADDYWLILPTEEVE